MGNTIEKLREYCNKAGITQTEMAERLGVTKAYVNAIFTGRSNIGKKMATKFEEEFGISSVWLLSGRGDMILNATEEQKNIIPLIPTAAIGGALSGTDFSFMEYECEQYVVPAFTRADYLMRVDGDSMYPKYCRGDIVACTKVPLTDLWFQWGRTYVVATRQGALIKYLEPGKDEGHITLASENPKYKPFQLPVTEINGVALVNGLIRVE